MSDPVRLSATLPGGEGNGLSAISAHLAKQPRTLRVVIAIVDCKEIRTNNDTGDVIPVARIRRIEALTADDLRAGRSLFRRAYERRTGREALPIDLEEEVQAAFDDITGAR